MRTVLKAKHFLAIWISSLTVEHETAAATSSHETWFKSQPRHNKLKTHTHTHSLSLSLSLSLLSFKHTHEQIHAHTHSKKNYRHMYKWIHLQTPLQSDWIFNIQATAVTPGWNELLQIADISLYHCSRNTSFSMVEEHWEKYSWIIRRAETTHNSQQQAKHANLYSKLFQAYRGNFWCLWILFTEDLNFCICSIPRQWWRSQPPTFYSPGCKMFLTSTVIYALVLQPGSGLGPGQICSKN